MTVKILHAHGYRGPKGGRSYMSIGTYRNRASAMEKIKKLTPGQREGYRIVDVNKIIPTKTRGLYWVKR